MGSKEKSVLRKRKKMMHAKLNSITVESEYVIELINDMQIQATSLVSELELETNEHTFLQKFFPVLKKLEKWHSEISRISYELDIQACKENGPVSEHSEITSTVLSEHENIHSPRHDEVKEKEDAKIWTIPCRLQEGDILDMRYILGDNPHDFWLRFYSTKELNEIRSSIQKLYEENRLLPLKTSLTVGAVVCVCDGNDYFRGTIIDHFAKPGLSYTIQNVDSGKIQEVEKGKVYQLTEEIAKIQVQRINCCLAGILGDPLLWDAESTLLFHEIMQDTSLVVTICSSPTDTCTKFTVKVDAHNDMRKESMIDLNKWVTNTVLPALVERKNNKSVDTLKPLFERLRVKAENEKSEIAEGVAVSNNNNTNSRTVSAKETSRKSQQYNSFQGMTGIPLQANQYTPRLWPYQNNSMFIHSPNHFGPPSVCQPVYPYMANVHRIQTPFMGAVPLNTSVPVSPQPLQIQAPAWPTLAPVCAQRNVLRKQASFDKKEKMAVGFNSPQISLGVVQQGSLLENHKQRGAPVSMNSSETPRQPGATQPESTSQNKISVSGQTELLPGKEDPKIRPYFTNKENKISLRHHKFEFVSGARYEAFVSHVVDPDEFYVHMVCSDNTLMEDLDKEMTKNYSTCFLKFKNKEQAKKMLFESWCAAFYEETQLWHRGKVINWKSDSDTSIIVQFVDYGEIQEVELSFIKPLKAEYTALPICATRCKLAQINPPLMKDSSAQSVWPFESAELFKILVNIQKMYTVVVRDSSANSLAVLLVDEDNFVINERLLNYDWAFSVKPIEFDPSLPIQKVKEHTPFRKDSTAKNLDHKVEKCEKDVLGNWDPMEEEYFSVSNTQFHDDENACYAVSGYVPQDEKRICKFYAENHCCFKGVTCTKEHSLPNPDGWTTDQETVLQNPINMLTLPPVGTIITLKITTICKVNMFYGLIHNKNNNEEEESLLTLNRHINQEENVRKMKRLQIKPAVGQLVLARYHEDGNFFRARVIDTHFEQYLIHVMYVDYGNTEWVNEKDIRDIEPCYLHLPFQAVECCISNFKPVLNSSKALQYVSELILGKELCGKITSKNILAQVEIELWDGSGQKIVDKLIEQGYGTFTDVPAFSSEDSTIIAG